MSENKNYNSIKTFFKEFLILMAILIGLSFIYFFILGILGIKINKSNPSEFDMIIMLYATITQLLAAIIFVKYEWKKNLSYIWVYRDNFLKNALVGSMIGFVQISIYVFLVLSLNYGKITSVNGFNVKVIFLLIGFFIQSTSEEFLVRGILTRALLNKYNMKVAIFLPSIIFGALHLFNDSVSIISTANTVLVGILYGVLILAFKNIWLVSFAHMAWNFSMSAIYGLTVSGIAEISGILEINLKHNFLTGFSYGPEGSFIVMIIEIISIILALIYARKRGLEWIRK